MKLGIFTSKSCKNGKEMYKKVWRTGKVVVLLSKLTYCFLVLWSSCCRRPRLILRPLEFIWRRVDPTRSLTRNIETPSTGKVVVLLSKLTYCFLVLWSSCCRRPRLILRPLEFIWRRVDPTRSLTRNIETPSQLFVYVIRSPSFVRKCMKSWITRGCSGRRVRVRVNFFRIDGAYFATRYEQKRPHIWNIVKS